MKKDIAEIWAQWLESGVIPQGKNALYTPQGACCLGVLCELHRQMTGEGEWSRCHLPAGVEDPNRRYYATTEGNPVAECLPPQVQEWAGMRTWNGGFPFNARESLAELNDKSVPFREIARIIRANASRL